MQKEGMAHMVLKHYGVKNEKKKKGLQGQEYSVQLIITFLVSLEVYLGSQIMTTVYLMARTVGE